MTEQQVNPTPKQRFQESDINIKEHHALLENPAFQRAEDVALLSYNRSLAYEIVRPENQNPQATAVQSGLKLAGVQEFLSIFRNLAEKPIPVQPPGLSRTLDHKGQSQS